MGLEKIAIEEAMRNQLKSEENASRGVVETGYIDLDYALGGLRRGETYLLGGSPAMGKTAFALNLMEHIAVT